jgi:hypothetical protein
LTMVVLNDRASTLVMVVLNDETSTLTMVARPWSMLNLRR